MPAYELSSGAVLDGVEAFCRHLAGTAGFGSATQPTLAEVQQWIDEAYYKIGGAIAKCGFSSSQTGSAAVGVLQTLQVYETVIKVELARPITGPGEPNERFKAFVTERNMMLEELCTTLSDLPDTEIATGDPNVEMTGLSISGKRAVRQDSDAVPHRFRRGQFDQPGSSAASQPASAETPE